MKYVLIFAAGYFAAITREIKWMDKELCKFNEKGE